MGFDDRRPRIEMKVPDMFEQHCPGDDLARMPHQMLKQPELARLKIDLPVADSAAATSKVEFEPADAEDGPQLQGWPAREGIDPRGEFGKRKRLDEIIVAAGLQSLHTVANAIDRSQEQYRC